MLSFKHINSNNMKLYELAYIANPSLSSEEASALQESIIKIITKEEGTPGKTSSSHKRPLAYVVKKQNEAYFSSMEFSILEDKLSNLEKKIRKENNILRFLIIKKPAVKKIVFEARPEKKRSLKPEKAKLKEIDKKIEEMI